MDIKITKKQNVKVDGVKYVAKPFDECAECAFNPGRELADVCTQVPCGQAEREDGRSVIFVRKTA